MADVRISGLEFRYPGRDGFGLRVAALEVGSGECAAIVGPSGSGKTTLLSLMAGTLLPQAGEISVGDERIDRLGESARRRFRIRRVGQVFQAFELLSYLSVIDNVLLPRLIDPAARADAEARQRAAALLESVGLLGKAQSRPANLSHGERQRVAVCRAMLNRPQLLLADEPTGNLDQANKRNVVNLLAHQARENDATLLMVTHDRALLESFQRVIDFETLTAADA